jgi:tryptophanase
MELVREGVNDQFGSSYAAETFQGTNFYKYFYALVQRLQENEVKTSEIVLKLQQYFEITNEEITRPNTTHPGLLRLL